MKIYINVDSTSLKAVTIGPEATAGSILNLAKMKGEAVPKKVAIKQDSDQPVTLAELDFTNSAIEVKKDITGPLRPHDGY